VACGQRAWRRTVSAAWARGRHPPPRPSMPMQSGMEAVLPKLSMNPFCEIALEVSEAGRHGVHRLWHGFEPPRHTVSMPSEVGQENQTLAVCPQEAIRLKEKKVASEVLAVTLGPASVQVRGCSARCVGTPTV
jgi:hypothetical protein